MNYRATLCTISAVLAVARCPSSLHLSVTLMYCVHTTEDIVKLLSRPGSSIILDYWASSADTQFQGEPLYRWQKVHGGRKKIAIFDQNRCLSRKPWLLWNFNRKS